MRDLAYGVLCKNPINVAVFCFVCLVQLYLCDNIIIFLTNEIIYNMPLFNGIRPFSFLLCVIFFVNFFLGIWAVSEHERAVLTK